jgi:hypothetical protein
MFEEEWQDHEIRIDEYEQSSYSSDSRKPPGDDLARRRFVLVCIISIAKMVLWFCYQNAEEEGIDVRSL